MPVACFRRRLVLLGVSWFGRLCGAFTGFVVACLFAAAVAGDADGLEAVQRGLEWCAGGEAVEVVDLELDAGGAAVGAGVLVAGEDGWSGDGAVGPVAAAVPVSNHQNSGFRPYKAI